MIAQTPEQQYKFDAFISYSHRDREAVNRLVSRLKLDNFKLWLDEEQIAGGDPLRDIMVEGIKLSRHVIVCLSPNYLQSEWTTFESLVNQAIDPANRRRRLIPVKIAPVDKIPNEYNYVYCPDLTNLNEAEYQKTIRRIRESRPIPDSTVVPVSQPETQHPDASEPKNNSQPPKPTTRLQAMGFTYHPFRWRDAGQMDLDVLEQTYTALPDFDNKVLDISSSTVLLAPYGGGKTAGRLKLAGHLREKQDTLSTNPLKPDAQQDIPLVVQFVDFEKIFGSLPKKITLNTHGPYLLDSIAVSVFDFINRYPDLFMSQSEPDRDFWWSFLDSYRLGRSVKSETFDTILMADYQRNARHSKPFTDDTGLARIIENISELLNRKLHVTSLVILVDGVDNQTQSQSDMVSILEPIVNHLGLFSIPRVIWKYFLPTILDETIRKSIIYKRGRVNILEIEWDEKSLQKFLSERLSWASGGTITDIAQNCEQDLLTSLGDVDARLAQMALNHARHGPPRAMLELAEILFQSGDHLQLTLADWIDFQRSVNADLRL